MTVTTVCIPKKMGQSEQQQKIILDMMKFVQSSKDVLYLVPCQYCSFCWFFNSTHVCLCKSRVRPCFVR